MAFFFKHLSLTGTTHHRIRRTEELEVPSNALREACLNAFTHRAWQYDNLQVNIAIYDDRVVIENPCRFPADIKPNELVRSEENNEKNTSQPQNEIIANVLYLTGTTEYWRRGLALIYDECDRVGVERPRYLNEVNFVRIVYKRPDMSKWTPDGFVKETVDTEKDTVRHSKDIVGHSQDTVRHSNEKTDMVQYKQSAITLIKQKGENWLSAYSLMETLGFKSKSSFIRNHISPALDLGLVLLEKPESPNAPTKDMD